MTEVLTKKCSYFNSGYCRYARREKGCKYYHPTDICESKKCDMKKCDKRHPKNCRHGDKCRFQTRCLYNHTMTNKERTNGHSEETERVIASLKSEITLLKKEIDIKVNILVKVHLKELNDLRLEKDNMLNDFNMSRDSINVALASKDNELQKANETIKQMEEEDARETHLCLIENEDLRKEIKALKKQDCQDCKNKTDIKIYISQLIKEFVNLTKDRTFKCKVCGKIIPTKREVIDHTMAEHQAKLVMEKNYNMKACLKAGH